MPAKSKAQQHAMGAALNCKRGGKCSEMSEKMASSMSEKQLKDFAGTKTKGLPAKIKPRKGK